MVFKAHTAIPTFPLLGGRGGSDASFLVLSPPQEGGGLEPALKWFSRGVGVKGLQVALVLFQSAHPHPNLPPVRGKGLVVASMQCNVIEAC